VTSCPTSSSRRWHRAYNARPWGLDDEIALAGQRHVEVAAALFEPALGRIADRRQITDESDGVARRAAGRARLHHIVREHHAFRLEGGGVHVGEIVGDDIELPPQRVLPR
jgi:hypothetical protein